MRIMFFRRGRIKPWILFVPESMRVRPLEVFLITLCTISGIPAIFGAPASNAIQQLLPDWFIRIWGTVLVLGSIALLYSIYKTPKDAVHGRQLLVTEKFGLRALSVGSLFYALIILVVAGWTVTSTFACGIILWFAFWCEVRVAVIKLLLKPWTPPDVKSEGGDVA